MAFCNTKVAIRSANTPKRRYRACHFGKKQLFVVNYVICWRNKMSIYVIFVANKHIFTKKDTSNGIF